MNPLWSRLNSRGSEWVVMTSDVFNAESLYQFNIIILGCIFEDHSSNENAANGMVRRTNWTKKIQIEV